MSIKRPNNYEVLGVTEGATAHQIKAAFRRLALKHHPDRNSGDSAAEERFKLINAAHAVLSDGAKRADYDRQLIRERQADRAAADKARLAEQARAAREKKAAEEAASSARLAEMLRSMAPKGRPTPPTPAPAPPSSGWGGLFAAALGLGLVAAAVSSRSDGWDPNTGRYRGPDGRFTSG
jgi:curved DNA-binding protein CbpA